MVGEKAWKMTVLVWGRMVKRLQVAQRQAWQQLLVMFEAALERVYTRQRRELVLEGAEQLCRHMVFAERPEERQKTE